MSTATVTPCVHVRIKGSTELDDGKIVIDEDNLAQDFQQFIVNSFKPDYGPPILGPRGGSSGLGDFVGWFWTEHAERIEAFFADRLTPDHDAGKVTS